MKESAGNYVIHARFSRTFFLRYSFNNNYLRFKDAQGGSCFITGCAYIYRAVVLARVGIGANTLAARGCRVSTKGSSEETAVA